MPRHPEHSTVQRTAEPRAPRIGAQGAAEQAAGGPKGSARRKRSNRKRNALVFGIVALAWLAIDVLSKRWFSDNFVQGDVVTEPILGIVRFHLVHNTGAAWGMFGDSTLMLGVLSLAVCALLAVYLFALSPKAGVVEAVGIALVVAGGLGNALDRFLLGYVVDFIEPTFIDFPVFNVADIGVTCGFVIFLAGMVAMWCREDRAAAQSAAGKGSASEGSDAR